jgi:acetyltransferase-like isoleucine patch superfamily enzyme
VPARHLSLARRAAADLLEPFVRVAALLGGFVGRNPEAIELYLRGRLLGGSKGWLVGRNVRFIGPSSAFDIDAAVKFYGNAYLNASGPTGRIAIGPNTHIDQFCVLYGQGGLTIESDCAIASGVILYTQTNHDAAHDGTPVSRQPVVYRPVAIEAGCWIGAGAIILPGARIGAGATIGAGAVVRSNVESRSTVVGVPARALAVAAR